MQSWPADEGGPGQLLVSCPRRLGNLFAFNPKLETVVQEAIIRHGALPVYHGGAPRVAADVAAGLVHTGSNTGVITACIDWVGKSDPTGATSTAAAPPVPPPNPSPWACPSCTFVNMPGNAFCEMCTTGNPSPPAPAGPAGVVGTPLASITLHMDVDTVRDFVTTLRGRVHHFAQFLFDNGHQRADGAHRQVVLVTERAPAAAYERLGITDGHASAATPIVQTGDGVAEVFIPQAKALALARAVLGEVQHPELTLPLELEFPDAASYLRVVVERSQEDVAVASL